MLQARIERVDLGDCRHLWDCPVIMKTRPDCRAWTCARCGAIAELPLAAAPARGGIRGGKRFRFGERAVRRATTGGRGAR